MAKLRNFLAIILHLIAIIHYIILAHYFHHNLNFPNHGYFKIFHVFGSGVNFLTGWNLIFQAAFFPICLLSDIYGNNGKYPVKESKFRKIQDFLHASIGFPLSMFVSSAFWCIWAVDREMVFPRVLDDYFPVWVNHSMHTTVAVYSMMHTLLCSTRYPARKAGVSTLFSINLAYLSWVLLIYFGAGLWPYPFLETLNWLQRGLFLAVSTSYALTLYFVGEYINTLIWGKSEKSLKTY